VDSQIKIQESATIHWGMQDMFNAFDQHKDDTVAEGDEIFYLLAQLLLKMADKN